MRFALLLESQEGLTWPDLFAVAGQAEKHGFDGLYVSDHYGPVDITQHREVLPAWMEIAVLANVTNRLRIGPLVSPVTLRHPVDLAHQAIALDVLSNGRIDLGMGAGWHDAEHIRFGRKFPTPGERVSRLEESLQVVSLLWRETNVTWSGQYYSLVDASILPRPVSAEPPIILGGGGPRMLNLAARFAKEWNCFYKSINEVEELQINMRGVCEAIGRDPRSLQRSLMTPLVVGRTEQEVDARIARHRAVFSGLPANAREWRESGFFGGTLLEVKEQIERLEAAGIERIVFEHNDPSDIGALELVNAELLGI